MFTNITYDILKRFDIHGINDEERFPECLSNWTTTAKILAIINTGVISSWPETKAQVLYRKKKKSSNTSVISLHQRF